MGAASFGGSAETDFFDIRGISSGTGEGVSTGAESAEITTFPPASLSSSAEILSRSADGSADKELSQARISAISAYSLGAGRIFLHVRFGGNKNFRHI